MFSLHLFLWHKKEKNNKHKVYSAHLMWKNRFEAAAKKLELTATLVNLESQVEFKRRGIMKKINDKNGLCGGSQPLVKAFN